MTLMASRTGLCTALVAFIWGFKSAAAQCLVGNVMYSEGDSIGFIGHACTGASTFKGTESFCRGGKVVDVPYMGTCTGAVPHCVQEGPAKMGAAVCLATP